MRNDLTRKGQLALLMVLCLWTFASGAAAQSGQTLDEALKLSKISVTLEGVEAGKSLQVVVRNLTDGKLVLLLPKGNLGFDLGRAKVTAVLEKQIAIDMEKQGTYKATFPQAGRTRVIKGKVTLRQAAGGFERAFENLAIGAAESK